MLSPNARRDEPYPRARTEVRLYLGPRRPICLHLRHRWGYCARSPARGVREVLAGRQALVTWSAKYSFETVTRSQIRRSDICEQLDTPPSWTSWDAISRTQTQYIDSFTDGVNRKYRRLSHSVHLTQRLGPFA